MCGRRGVTRGHRIAKPGSGLHSSGRSKGGPMLWIKIGILLALWLLGVVSANTFGGFIHLLLVVAIGVALMRAIEGRRPV